MTLSCSVENIFWRISALNLVKLFCLRETMRANSVFITGHDRYSHLNMQVLIFSCSTNPDVLKALYLKKYCSSTLKKLYYLQVVDQ